MGSFITNKEKFNVSTILNQQLAKSKAFDCLVGYLYKSGFYKIQDKLESVKEIRMLVGISVDKRFYEEVELAKTISVNEIKKEVKKNSIIDLESADFTLDVEQGILKLKDWLKSGKLKIRACQDKRTHAKVYIMSYDEEHTSGLQVGSVITGSSNLTEAGLESNVEFNVFLQDQDDYIGIRNLFDDLWENHSVELSDFHRELIEKLSPYREDISPFEFYLKFLQEYFKEELEFEERKISAPNNLMDLDYQKDAVARARKILNKYGGVFISDVVGLGKTFITTMLAKEIPGKTLVIAPPMLVNENNPGSWPNVFDAFEIHHKGSFESLGKLDKILRRGVEDYENIIIDEAHRFRNSDTKMYNDLRAICMGKNVILVTATPLNNRPDDLANQLALFTPMKNAKYHPSIKDLSQYFTEIRSKKNKLRKQLDEEEITRKDYLNELKIISEDIRNRILSKVMIRRTREDIKRLFKKDMDIQGLKFPEVQNPKTLYYKFDEKIDKIFEDSLELLLNEKNMKYSRYAPILYLKKEIEENKKTPQKNIKNFMKILIAKRLESSFYAFRKTLNRFMDYYRAAIKSYDEKGYIVISENYYSKVFDYINEDNWEDIDKLVESEDATKYLKKEFKTSFRKDLQSDLETLEKVKKMWDNVKEDPKLDSFKEFLKEEIKKEKIIVFSESKDTADYLKRELNREDVVTFSGSSGDRLKEEIIDNFDYFVKNKKDKYNILISTDTLSEGVNLNRANRVLNYDIPWNPIKVIQRVGRIDRIAKKLPFDKIHIYNFFPAKKINDKIKLQENAEEKISSFIRLLGKDSKHLFEDEEICSHKEFFQHLNSSTRQEDSLTTIEDTERAFIRDMMESNREEFKKIESLPKKIKIARKKDSPKLFTFFKKGDFKFAYSDKVGEILNFEDIINIIKADKNEKAVQGYNKKDFYSKFSELKQKFIEDCKPKRKYGAGLRGNAKKIIDKINSIKKDKRLYEKELDNLEKIGDLLREDKLPNKRILARCIKLDNIEAYKYLKDNIPKEFFKKYKVEEREDENKNKPEEIILSEWFV